MSGGPAGAYSAAINPGPIEGWGLNPPGCTALCGPACNSVCISRKVPPARRGLARQPAVEGVGGGGREACRLGTGDRATSDVYTRWSRAAGAWCGARTEAECGWLRNRGRPRAAAAPVGQCMTRALGSSCEEGAADLRMLNVTAAAEPALPCPCVVGTWAACRLD